MKLQEINVKKYTIEVSDENYIVYVIPEVDSRNGMESINFYLQKESFGFIQHMFGMQARDMSESEYEDYIKAYLTDGVRCYNQDLEKLEGEN